MFAAERRMREFCLATERSTPQAIMHPGTRRTPAASRLLAGTVLLVTALACGGRAPESGTAAAPQAIAGDIERTTFDAKLGVHLDSMTKRASGMYVQDHAMGTGGVATRGRTVVVQYVGWLPDGKQFDAGEITVTLGTNKTIRAWEEGLLGMRQGGRRRLIVPPNLGYGSRGAGNDIPPNSVLIFEMEVRAVY
jgi:FKBP-type peptidyl-prolyl cis-trans isomerase